MTKYSIDESKSLHETYTQEEIDKIIEDIPTQLEIEITELNDDVDYLYQQVNTLQTSKQGKVLYGTSTPSSSTGSNGDIYLKYS